MADWQQEKISILQKKLDNTERDQALAKAIGAELEQKLGSIQTKQHTIKEKVIRETIEKPVYRDCVTTPDGVRLIEDAISTYQ